MFNVSMVSGDQPPPNPLALLYTHLEELHPRTDNQNPSWVTAIDIAMSAGGNLEVMLYRSSIAYIARRLVTAAQRIAREVDHHERASEIFHQELRVYLQSHTSYAQNVQEQLHAILTECVRLGEQDISPGLKRRLLKESSGGYCKICRRVFADSEDRYLAPTVDHDWPRSLGGGNDEQNLSVVCVDCNARKADRLNGSDFHYEAFSFKVYGIDDRSFRTQVTRTVQLGVILEHHCECAGMREDEQCVGEMTLARRDISDSWHYLNLLPYCERHNPETTREPDA